MIHELGMEDDRKEMSDVLYSVPGISWEDNCKCMNPAAHDAVLYWVARESQQSRWKVLEGMSRGLGMSGSKWVPGKGSRKSVCLKSQRCFFFKA